MTSGMRAAIPTSSGSSATPLWSFSAVASGSVTAPRCTSIEATSISHASPEPVAWASAPVSSFSRELRPNAAGLAAASTSVRARIAPCSVCSSSSRSATSARWCASAPAQARLSASRSHGLRRKRKI